MSVEERLYRIQEEKRVAAEQWEQRRKEKLAEYPEVALEVDRKLQELRELGVAQIIEEFTDMPLIPLTTSNIESETSSESELPQVPAEWPNAEEIRERWREIEERRMRREKMWSAHVELPELGSENLEWDNRLHIVIVKGGFTPFGQRHRELKRWVDVFYEDVEYVNGKEKYLTIKGDATDPYLDETLPEDFQERIEKVEEALARAVDDPKIEKPLPPPPYPMIIR